jgi:hypothetical protein
LKSCLFQIAQRSKADARLLDRIAHPAQINIAISAALHHLFWPRVRNGPPSFVAVRHERALASLGSSASAFFLVKDT